MEATVVRQATVERDLAARLNFARTHRDFTMKLAGDRAGFRLGQWSHIESARHANVEVPTLHRLAVGCDTTIAYLLGELGGDLPPHHPVADRLVDAGEVRRTFGIRLRQAREHAGLSVAGLANAAALPHRRTVLTYELDHVGAQLVRLVRLADALGVPASWLAGEGNGKPWG